MISSAVESFSGGFVALLRGIERSVSSPDIRWTYLRFLGHFFMLSLVGYNLVAATIITPLILTCLVFLGPVFGPIAVGVVVWSSIVVLSILWLLGKFPTHFFVGSFGILRPFFTATQLSFLLASLLIPIGCDGFMLLGADLVCPPPRGDDDRSVDTSTAARGVIRTQYKKATFATTLRLFCCQFAFRVAAKSLIWLVMPASAQWVSYPALSAFLLGSQLVSVYTVRVRRWSYIQHLKWCFLNCFRILGFSLPLHCAQERKSILSQFISLGLAYSVSASLVEPIILTDTKENTASVEGKSL